MLNSKKNGGKYILNHVAAAGCCFLLLLFACSKGSDPAPTPVPIPPVSTNPTGVISSFTVDDTLVAYKGSTILHWLVTSYNSYTIVTVNGIKVANYGSWDTGPLTAPTQYVLAINNGVKDSLKVTVADSLITSLWNTGKRLKITRREYWAIPRGDSVKAWVDTSSVLTPQVLDQRLYIALTGSTNIIQMSSSYPSAGYSGKIIPQAGDSSFIWNSRIYTVDSLTDRVLLVHYNTPLVGNSTQLTRDRYLFE